MFDEGVAGRYAGGVGFSITAGVDAGTPAITSAGRGLKAINSRGEAGVDVGGNQSAREKVARGGLAFLERAKATLGLDGTVGLALRRRQFVDTTRADGDDHDKDYT